MNFVTAVAFHLCLALPAAFPQPRDHLLSEPCISVGRVCLWGKCARVVRPRKFDVIFTVTSSAFSSFPPSRSSQVQRDADDERACHRHPAAFHYMSEGDTRLIPVTRQAIFLNGFAFRTDFPYQITITILFASHSFRSEVHASRRRQSEACMMMRMSIDSWMQRQSSLLDRTAPLHSQILVWPTPTSPKCECNTWLAPKANKEGWILDILILCA